jgi:hypothetical protein
MIQYVDGQEACVGDKVLIDNGERIGIVDDVIDNDSKLREWGVEQPGLMIKSDYYGLLFRPVDCLEDDEISLISRCTE